MKNRKSFLTSMFCTLAGAVLVLSAPSVLRAFLNSASDGFDKFWSEFCKYFVNYLNASNIAIALMTAILIQPVFILIRFICRKVKVGSAVTVLFCTIFGGLAMLAIPSLIYSLSHVWNNGFAEFATSFNKAFVHYTKVGNIAITLVIALAMQPAFRFIGWFCTKISHS